MHTQLREARIRYVCALPLAVVISITGCTGSFDQSDGYVTFDAHGVDSFSLPSRSTAVDATDVPERLSFRDRSGRGISVAAGALSDFPLEKWWNTVMQDADAEEVHTLEVDGTTWSCRWDEPARYEGLVARAAREPHVVFLVSDGRWRPNELPSLFRRVRWIDAASPSAKAAASQGGQSSTHPQEPEPDPIGDRRASEEPTDAE